MTAHTFPEGEGDEIRCTDCGTLKAQYDRAPHLSPCPQRYPTDPTVRAIPQSIVNDDLTARLAELKAEREAAWNTVRED